MGRTTFRCSRPPVSAWRFMPSRSSATPHRYASIMAISPPCSICRAIRRAPSSLDLERQEMRVAAARRLVDDDEDRLLAFGLDPIDLLLDIFRAGDLLVIGPGDHV